MLFPPSRRESLARKNNGGYKGRGRERRTLHKEMKEIHFNTSRVCTQFKVASFNQKLVTKTKWICPQIPTSLILSNTSSRKLTVALICVSLCSVELYCAAADACCARISCVLRSGRKKKHVYLKTLSKVQ